MSLFLARFRIMLPRWIWVAALAVLIVLFLETSRGTEPVMVMAMIFRGVVVVIGGTVLVLLAIDRARRTSR